MMRTWIIIILITIICFGIVVSERYSVNGFCDDLSASLDNYDGSNADKIYNLWDERKQKIYVFVNHNYFDELEKELFELKNSDEDYGKKILNVKRSKEITKDLKNSINLTVGNLF